MVKNQITDVGPSVACYLWDNSIEFGLLKEPSPPAQQGAACIAHSYFQDLYSFRMQIEPNKFKSAFRTEPTYEEWVLGASDSMLHELTHVVQLRDGTAENAKAHYPNSQSNASYVLEAAAEQSTLWGHMQRGIRDKMSIVSRDQMSTAIGSMINCFVELREKKDDLALLKSLSSTANNFKMLTDTKWYPNITLDDPIRAEDLERKINSTPTEVSSLNIKDCLEDGEVIVDSRDIVAEAIKDISLESLYEEDRYSIATLKELCTIYSGIRNSGYSPIQSYHMSCEECLIDNNHIKD